VPRFADGGLKKKKKVPSVKCMECNPRIVLARVDDLLSLVTNLAFPFLKNSLFLSLYYSIILFWQTLSALSKAREEFVPLHEWVILQTLLQL
jgi:hypothetical protein